MTHSIIEVPLYGLIGKTLSHSFSKTYFMHKFEEESIQAEYELFEIENVHDWKELPELYPNLRGLNVTIPYKEDIMATLDSLHTSATEAEAVNVIKITKEGEHIGYNSDTYGFKTSLLKLIGEERPNVLVLGTGGASKAVQSVLKSLNIDYKVVSRTASGSTITYADITLPVVKHHCLIVNATPLGTFPNISQRPDLPYYLLTQKHYLFDLVYNPNETTFMKQGKEHGAKTMNGMQMLQLQAEEAWRIWNE